MRECTHVYLINVAETVTGAFQLAGKLFVAQSLWHLVFQPVATRAGPVQEMFVRGNSRGGIDNRRVDLVAEVDWLGPRAIDLATEIKIAAAASGGTAAA